MKTRFFSSNHPLNHSLRWQIWLILLLAAALSVGGYLLASGLYYHTGFPLDDAWIHQTYARNLALRGEWSFVPGQVSGGSTAPLWSALLAIGFWLGLAPYGWAYLLGILALWLLAVTSEVTVRRLVPVYAPRIPWVGLALAFEWHLVWAAASGMETLLAALLFTVVLSQVLSRSEKYFGMGLLVGLSVWVRPDGIILLGPVLVAALFNLSTWRERLRALTGAILGFGGLFALYLLFNLVITGSPWPNTFYAKQAEYAVYVQLPLLQRLGAEFLQPLIGAGLALLPGVALIIISSLRKKIWGVLASLVWLAGYLGLYALRLPVTYQHGRYVIPAMPIFFLLGLAGLAELGFGRSSGSRWLLSTFWKVTAATILVTFWSNGAYAYARDVAVIESEMVDVAGWVSANVPPDALVAAHDIGALGYFGKHEIVDLAGLVSPDVIPFIRDEARLADYLDERGVTYLITFPDWYPLLTSDLVPIYSTSAPYAPSFGEMNMAVYQWPSP